MDAKYVKIFFIIIHGYYVRKMVILETEWIAVLWKKHNFTIERS